MSENLEFILRNEVREDKFQIFTNESRIMLFIKLWHPISYVGCFISRQEYFDKTYSNPLLYLYIECIIHVHFEI